MPRQDQDDNDWRYWAALRTATRGVSRGVARILHNLGEERGKISEGNALDALMVLQSMGMPIQFHATERGGAKDRQGMDIIIHGEKPLHLAHLALDIKSNQFGVEQYLEKQRKILEKTKRPQIPPRYPFLIPSGEGGNSCRLLKELAIFLLGKSRSHACKVEWLKKIDPRSKTGMDDLAALIERIFSETPEEL